jgi:hypothetical protein
MSRKMKSIMARSKSAPPTAEYRTQDQSSSDHHIRLAPRGRSIQTCQKAILRRHGSSGGSRFLSPGLLDGGGGLSGGNITVRGSPAGGGMTTNPGRAPAGIR